MIWQINAQNLPDARYIKYLYTRVAIGDSRFHSAKLGDFKMLKKILIISSLVLCSQANADTRDWSAKFKVGPKHDHIISHTPEQVCLDSMICGGEGIFLGAGTSINGVKVAATCDLDLQTKMTKPEFIAAMKCAGLDPKEKK